MPTDIYNDDGQFTDEYKFKASVHPIVQNIFSYILQSKKMEKECTAREVHDAFFFALDESSKKFHALGMQAFEEAEIVQNGLRLANDVLYQLLPVISEMQPYQENYRKVNKLFWGKFFYLNGLDEAKKFEGSYATSPWEIARFYASEFWRFGQDDFPETISWGYLYLLENDPAHKVDFTKAIELLTNFEYSKEVALGFSYILGVVAMTARGDETSNDIITRSSKLPYVDINCEFEALLGPLRDNLINRIFDELIWRFDAKIDAQEITIEGIQRAVHVYEIKNHQLIEKSDRQVHCLYDAEKIFTSAMELIGKELARVGHSFENSYRAGVCAANLRAQGDYRATGQVAAACQATLPLIMAACQSSIDNDISWGGHLKIQVPLQKFINGLPVELAKMIWGYQSYVLFSEGDEKAGVEQLDITPFMEECRKMALVFFDANREACRIIALQKEHWRTFSHMSKDFDEKPLILETIKNSLGYNDGSKKLADRSTLKALIIFGYFCSLCETILLEEEPPKLN